MAPSPLHIHIPKQLLNMDKIFADCSILKISPSKDFLLTVLLIDIRNDVFFAVN